MSLSLMRLSCTKIESPQLRRKLFAFRPGFVTPPILATPVETFRPPSLFKYAAALAGPLSLPTPCRPTPIMTTALRFAVQLGVEGKISVRLAM
jgi:hypothetical protein